MVRDWNGVGLAAVIAVLAASGCSSSKPNNEEGGGNLPLCNPVPSGACEVATSASCFYCADQYVGAVCGCNATTGIGGPVWECLSTEQSGQCENWSPPDASR